jgi:hypothetical protein
MSAAIFRRLPEPLRRALPAGLPWPLQAFIIAGWVVMIGLGVFIASYAETSPKWQMRGLYLIALGASFAVAATAALSQLWVHPLHRVAAAAALLVMSLLPMAVAKAGGDGLVFLLSAVCLLAAAAALNWPPAPGGDPVHTTNLRRPWIVAALLLGCWVPPCIIVLWHSATGQPSDDLAVAAFIPALAALIMPFYDLSAIAAVTSAGLTRRNRVMERLGRYHTVSMVLLLILVKTIYVLNRVTVSPDFFGDRTLWTLSGQSLVSWLHASLLAVAICVIAQRSKSRPLSNRAWTGSLLLLSLVPALPFLIDILRFMAFAVLFLLSPNSAQELVDRWLVSEQWNEQTPWRLMMGGCAVFIGGVAAWRWQKERWSAAVVLLALGFASILPQAVAPLLQTSAALPTQVDLLITAGVLGLVLIRQVKGSNDRLGNRIFIRLVVIPFVVIHATVLVPAIWESEYFPLVAVAWLIYGALTLPKISGAVSTARRRLEFIGGELATLTTIALITLTNNHELMVGTGLTTGMSLMLLAIPLGGALSCRTEALDRD